MNRINNLRLQAWNPRLWVNCNSYITFSIFRTKDLRIASRFYRTQFQDYLDQCIWNCFCFVNLYTYDVFLYCSAHWMMKPLTLWRDGVKGYITLNMFLLSNLPGMSELKLGKPQADHTDGNLKCLEELLANKERRQWKKISLEWPH